MVVQDNRHFPGPTILRDVDNLITDLGASAKYKFRFVLFTRQEGTTEGIKLALNGTVGVTSLKASVWIWNQVANSLGQLGRLEAFGATVGFTIPNSGDHYCEILGTIETSTAGNFKAQFAQNATGGSAGVSVEINSYLEVSRLT